MEIIIIPKLELKKKSDSEFDEYVLDKIGKVPVNFPVTDPTIANVTTKHTAYHDAVVKAIDGTKADTDDKNTLRRELSIMTTNLANDCARRSDGDTAKFLSTGFAMKSQGSPVGILPAPQDFVLKAGDNEREMDTNWKKVDKADKYQVRLGIDPENPDSWMIEAIVSPSKAHFTGLESGKKYYARVRAIGSKGLYGNWSDISSKRCP
ncbi:MAG: hypothetical protein ACHQNT_07140 [Bacteroidia bacterium]